MNPLPSIRHVVPSACLPFCIALIVSWRRLPSPSLRGTPAYHCVCTMDEQLQFRYWLADVFLAVCKLWTVEVVEVGAGHRVL